MRISELVLKYVQALVWPATALAITYLFRQQLRQILVRLTRVEAAGASLEFAVETAVLSRQAEAVEASLPTAGEGPGPTDAVEGQADQDLPTFEGRPWATQLGWVRAIVNISPSGAAAGARNEVVKEAARVTGLGAAFEFASDRARRDALARSGVGPEAIWLYERFMRLTDRRPEDISVLMASDLLDTAEVLLRAMSEASG